MSKRSKFLVALVVAAGFVALAVTLALGPHPYEMAQSEFNAVLKTPGAIHDLDWQDRTVSGHFSATGLKPYATFELDQVPSLDTSAGADFKRQLDDSGVSYRIDSSPLTNSLFSAVSVIFFPLMVIGIIYFLVMRPMMLGRVAIPVIGAYGNSRLADRIGNAAAELSVVAASLTEDKPDEAARLVKVADSLLDVEQALGGPRQGAGRGA